MVIQDAVKDGQLLESKHGLRFTLCMCMQKRASLSRLSRVLTSSRSAEVDFVHLELQSNLFSLLGLLLSECISSIYFWRPSTGKVESFEQVNVLGSGG